MSVSGGVVRIGELNIAFNHPQDLASILEVYALDAYHRRLLHSGDLVLDVGAGIGDFTMLAAKLVGNSGLVVAVEPSPTDFETLSRNIVGNGLTNVFPVNCAVGSERKTAELRFKGGEFRAPVQTLTSILEAARKKRPKLAAVGFLKLDIEGAETTALESMGGELEKVRVIAIELHRTREAVDRVLGPLGFQFAGITRAHYLSWALLFSIRYPVLTVKLWRLLGEAGLRPSVRKMLTGIEIARDEDLSVGVFRRPAR